MVSEKTKNELATQGVAVTGYIGGLRKTKYWTPDGREILAIPSMRTWQKTKIVNGKKEITGSGLRDANLDKWLIEPPQNPKIHCDGCDKWHDTQEEVEKCIEQREVFIKKHSTPEVDDRIGKVESEVSEIKNMLAELLKR